MSDRLRRWLILPALPGDEDKSRQVAILNLALLTIMLFSLIVTAGNLLGGHTPSLLLLINVSSFLSAVGLRVWLARGHARSTSILLLIAGMFGTTAAIVMLGTIRTPTTAMYMALVVGAGLVLGLPGIIATCITSSLLVLALVLAENTGILPPPDFSVTLTQWVTYTALFTFAGGLAFLTMQTMRRALVRADNEIIERKRIEVELEHRNRELAMLNQVNHALTSSLDLDQVLTQLLNQVDNLLNTVGAFWLLDANTNELVCRQASGPAGAQVRGWRLRLGEGIAGWVAQTGESVLVADALTDARHFPGISKQTGVVARSLLCVPVKTPNRVIGVLQVMDRAPNRFDATHLTLAESLAATGAIAIENARLYAESQSTAQALRDSEARFRAVIDSVNDVVYTLDRDEKHTGVFGSWVERAGLTPAFFIGKTAADIFGADAGVAHREPNQRALNGETVVYEWQSGAQWFQTSVSPLRDARGGIIGIVGVGRDISLQKQIEAQLRESEEKFRRVVEESSEAIVLVNEQGQIIEWNKSATELVGLSRDQALGLTLLDLQWQLLAPERRTPENYADTQKSIEQALRTGSAPFLNQSIEANITRVDGTRRTVLQTAFPIQTRRGYMIGISSFDITQRKHLEQEVEKERDFALQVMNAMGQGLAITDATGHLEYVNPAYALMLGRTPAEVLGKPTFELHHPDDWEKLSRGRMERTHGKTTVNEVRIIRPDGAMVTVLVTGVPRFQENKFIGSITVITDLTERKKMEHAFKTERDFAMRVMNTMGQGLTITDAEGRFEFVNPSYAEMMGYTREELIGKHPADVTVPEDVPGLERARSERKLGKVNTYESRLVRKDGSVVPVLITGVPRSSDGEYTGAIAVITDLTEQKRTEARLRYLGTHDTLTGIYNRTFFEEELTRLTHSREYPISLVVVDVDDMKLTNDTLGHAAGDELLKRTARILQASFRASDILARIGGDEFAVLLPNTDGKIAAHVLARVRERLAEHNCQFVNEPVALSLGAATTHDNLLDAFKQADAQMYEDKRTHKT